MPTSTISVTSERGIYGDWLITQGWTFARDPSRGKVSIKITHAAIPTDRRTSVAQRSKKGKR